MVEDLIAGKNIGKMCLVCGVWMLVRDSKHCLHTNIADNLQSITAYMVQGGIREANQN